VVVDAEEFGAKVNRAGNGERRPEVREERAGEVGLDAVPPDSRTAKRSMAKEEAGVVAGEEGTERWDSGKVAEPSAVSAGVAL